MSMKKRTKKVLATMMSCVMLGTAVGGATLAYLTDNETATNTITVGKVDIELSEPNWPDQDPDSAADDVILKVPTEEVLKDPLVKNVGNNPAIIFMSVEVPKENVSTIGFDGNNFQSADEKKEVVYFKLADDDPKSLNNNFNTGTEISGTTPAVDGKWILLEKKEGENSNIYIFGYDTRVDSGKETEPLFEKIQLINAVNDESYNVNAKDIIINAYAIQQNNIGDGLADGELNETTLESIYDILINQIEATGGSNDSGNTGGGNGADNSGNTDDDVVSEVFAATFDLRGGTVKSEDGNEPLTVFSQQVNEGEFVEEPDVNPTKNGYSFTGWYSDTLNTQLYDFREPMTGFITIYAGWDKLERDASEEALFVTGKELTKAMKSMAAGKEIKDHFTVNENITSIKMADSMPDLTAMTDQNIVSLEKSEIPIYMWFDSGDGTIYWWSEDETPVMNTDSSYIFYNMYNLADIEDVQNWDCFGAFNMESMFYSTAITNVDALSNWDVSCANSISTMFQNCYNLKDIEGLKNWDVSAVTDLSNLFYRCSSLENLDSLKNWNTYNVTTLSAMFESCENLNNIEGLINWDTSSVTYMSDLFRDCYSLANFDALSNWDVRNLSSVEEMFYGCKLLEEVDCLSNWNTMKLNIVEDMFNKCTSLENINGMKDWDMDDVTDFNSMFDGCSSLTDVSALKNWGITKITNLQYMFRGCNSIKAFDLRTWDFSNVPNISNTYKKNVFAGCNSVEYAYARNSSDVDILNGLVGSYLGWSFTLSEKSDENIVAEPYLVKGSIFNTKIPNTTRFVSFTDKIAPDGATLIDMSHHGDGSVVAWEDGTTLYISSQKAGIPVIANESMYRMLYNKSSIRKIDATMLDVSRVISMESAFERCTNLNELVGVDTWDMRNVISVEDMFNSCLQLYNIDFLKSWNTKSVTTMLGMFIQCPIYNVDALSDWDTSSLKDITGMFERCSNLNDLGGLSNFNTSNITYMAYTFTGCTSLTTLDGIEDWNTAKLRSMQHTFSGCSSLADIDAIEDWNVSRVVTLYYAFENCVSLKDLSVLDGWNISRVSDYYYMLNGCSISEYPDWNGDWNAEGTFIPTI